MKMPPAVLASGSTRRIRTRSCNGRSIIDGLLEPEFMRELALSGRECQRASRHMGRNAVEYKQKLIMRFASFHAATRYPQRSYEFNRHSPDGKSRELLRRGWSAYREPLESRKFLPCASYGVLPERSNLSLTTGTTGPCTVLTMGCTSMPACCRWMPRSAKRARTGAAR